MVGPRHQRLLVAQDRLATVARPVTPQRLTAFVSLAAGSALIGALAAQSPSPAGRQVLPAAGERPVRVIAQGGDALKYWPFWRGPSMQGLVEGKGYPSTWSESEHVIWRVEVPGRGHSSPIVWADRIFLTTAATDGSSRSVLCFRRSDGRLLWERAVPEAPAEKLYPKNSYASSSPTTDGRLVYAFFGSAGVVAVDFNGRIAWHAAFGPVSLYHGPGGSPVLYKDRLILYQEQRLMDRTATAGPGFMVALDSKTGRELWRQTRTPQPGWGTPLPITAGDHDEIIVSSSRRIEGVDPATGTVLWYSTGNTFEVIPMPVAGHGLVYCSSGRAGPTFAVRPGGSGDVTASHLAWSTPKGSSFVPSPLLLGDYLYTVNDMVSVVTCHHAKTGEVVGQLRLGEAKREGFSASPVAVGGRIYFTNDDGETFVVNPAPDFRLLHVNRIGEQTLASPALVDGRWYIRTAGHLVAIGKSGP